LSKTLTVRYFAIFRENAGTGEESVSLDADTAADVFALLKDRHGSSEPLGHCKVAINDAMSDWDAAVEDGDTILLFPPVAGG
jgi:sulfur-carrier protein